MVLSSYEVVRRAITFERPDRLPVSIPDLGLDDPITFCCWSGACG